jgi:hypothetical protein
MPVHRISYPFDANNGVLLTEVSGANFAVSVGSNFNAAFPAAGLALGVGNNNVFVPVSATNPLPIAGNFNATSTPVTSNNAATSPGVLTVGTASIQVLAANPARKRFTLQNGNTTILYTYFGNNNGNNTAASNNWHLTLRAEGVPGDGSGEIYSDIMWTGAVQMAGSANGGTVAVTEFT